MRKVELEEHHDQYLAKEARIREMVRERQFPPVFTVCVDSFPHLVHAMKYRKRVGIVPETPEFSAFSVICKYAPVLFEHSFIVSMHEFILANRQLARHENGYLQACEAALELEETSRAIWNHLERNPGTLQRDTGPQVNVAQPVTRGILELWEHLGVIIRVPERGTYRLGFRTRLDVQATGVCHSCGVRGKGMKELFLKPITCQKCNTQGYYHICPDSPVSPTA
jgi:hypothetical protein